MQPGQYSDEAMIADVERSLTNQPPTPEQIERIELVRLVAKTMARAIIENSRSSAARTIAIRKLEEMVMWAVKSIVLEDAP